MMKSHSMSRKVPTAQYISFFGYSLLNFVYDFVECCLGSCALFEAKLLPASYLGCPPFLGHAACATV